MIEARTASSDARDLATFVRSLVALILIGVSVALAAGHTRNLQLTALISANTLSAAGRKLLLVTLAVGAGGGLALAAALILTQRTRAGIRRMSRVARLLAPVGLVGFVPTLVMGEGWPDLFKLTVALGVFVLALEPLWRLHFSAYRSEELRTIAPAPASGSSAVMRWLRSHARRVTDVRRALVNRVPARLRDLLRRRGPAITVAGMAIFYIVYMSFYTVRNHHRFNSFTWDLGQIDNQFYNFLHGHPFRCTALIREGDWSELRNHAEAAMFFLLPIYALWPAAETLLVLQALLLGAAGIFVYRFAARRISRPMALALTAAYYLYPPLHGAQFFDLHFQPVAAAFLLVAIDAFDTKRMRLFALFFVLAISCREDISVGTAVFGLFLILTGHRARAGIIIMMVSLAYFVALRFFIMPAIGTWGFAEHYRVLFPEGERTFAGILKTIVSNPVFTFTTFISTEKLRYALQLLVPLAFLPLRRAHLAMSILPGAYFTFLTTEYPPTLSIGYQYSGYFLPYFFPAAALALAAIAKQANHRQANEPQHARGPSAVARQRAAVATLLVATGITTTLWGAIPPRKSFNAAYGAVTFLPPTADQERWGAGIEELARMIPRAAILAVTDREMPHVSNRLECWNLSSSYVGSDYIIFTEDHPLPQEREQFDAALKAGYTRVADRPGLVLLKRPGAP